MKFEPTLHKLSNDITVIMDPMDIETVNMKIYIRGGSRIEQPHEYGISHFIEHMLFVGTKRFPTRQNCNDFLQDYGGTRNGGTSSSYTAYYGRILSENASILIDVLSDMFFNSTIESEKINTESDIITQEIKRSRDDEERKFSYLVTSNVLKDSYLAKYDNMGTFDTIKSFSRQDLINYKNNKYTANNIIIGIGGKISDKEKILENLESLFSSIKSGDEAVYDSGTINPSIIYDEQSDKKQTRLSITFEFLYPDLRQYDYELMCVSAFESALHRRLYEEIRKQGLAYNFSLDSYGDRFVGVDGFYTSLSPEKLDDMVRVIAEFSSDILNKNPITDAELNRKNAMIKLRRADFMESSTKRIDKLLSFYDRFNELYDPKVFDKMREKMTTSDIMKHSANYFSSPINIIAQGPKCDIDMKKIWEDNFKG